jgi:WD40 repeat protein
MMLHPKPRIELIKDFTASVGHISSVAISNDGNWVAIAGTGQLYQYTSYPTSIELYDRNWQQSIDKQKIEHKIGKCRTDSICFTSDGNNLIMQNNDRKSISCWDINHSSIALKTFDFYGNFSGLFPHPNDGTFFVIDCFYTVRQFSIVNNLLLEKWSRSYSDDLELKKWSQSYHNDLQIENHALRISDDGEYLYGIASIVCGNNLFEKVKIRLPKSTPQYFSVRLSPDQNILVTGSDQRIRISDARSAKIIHSFYAHADFVGGLLITSDSRFLISTADFTIKIWDLTTGRKLNTIIAHPTHRIKSTAFNRNTGTIVTGHDDGTVKIWQLS